MTLDRWYTAAHELMKHFKICAQCKSNASSNFAGGYPKVAIECVQYCLDGHHTPSKEKQPVASIPYSIPGLQPICPECRYGGSMCEVCQ
jgi:hypothetical protein